MAWQDDVQATLESLCKLRADLVASQAAGKLKPSYEIHGHKFDWVQYLQYLSSEIDNCRRQLAEGSPFLIVTAGR